MTKEINKEKTYELCLIKGVEGFAIYLNDFRIAGPKPWSGGDIIKTWGITFDDIRQALGIVEEVKTGNRIEHDNLFRDGSRSNDKK